MRNLLPVYNLRSAIVDIKSGRLIPPWNSFFQQFVEAAPQPKSIIPDGSPFSYTPNSSGFVLISGGTVSLVRLRRGVNDYTIATSTTNPVQVPLSLNDTVIVTYTVAPTMTFFGD